MQPPARRRFSRKTLTPTPIFPGARSLAYKKKKKTRREIRMDGKSSRASGTHCIRDFYCRERSPRAVRAEESSKGWELSCAARTSVVAARARGLIIARCCCCERCTLSVCYMVDLRAVLWETVWARMLGSRNQTRCLLFLRKATELLRRGWDGLIDWLSEKNYLYFRWNFLSKFGTPFLSVAWARFIFHAFIWDCHEPEFTEITRGQRKERLLLFVLCYSE